MKCSIAIYPGSDFKQQLSRWETYIKTSRNYGFTEIFSSMHLPEFSVEQQIDVIKELAGMADACGMELTVDIGGNEIQKILDNPIYDEAVRQAGLDFVRLDYGYSAEQEKRMLDSWGLKGFVINASIYSKDEFIKQKKRIESLGMDIEIRACHNYYPRPESGLCQAFFRKQNEILDELGIPVYSCIPSRINPRMPLRQGLPTLEHHRYLGVEQITCELVNCEGNHGILAADEFFPEEELKAIYDIIRKEPLELHVTWMSGVTQKERNIVEKQVHHIRFDSNQSILRSQSSREMSQFAQEIAPRHSEVRKPGMITIDNSLYNRYSGELQIVLQELPKDERINLVAQIEEKDMWKLEFYRSGYDFKLLEKEQ